MTESNGGSGEPRWPEATAVAAFLVSAAASVGVAVVYATGGEPQLEGLLLGAAFAGLGVGLVIWAHRLLPKGPFVEPRPVLSSGPAEREATDVDLERGGIVTRRRVLLGSLLTATAAFLGAAIFPLRSLGPRPDGALRRTPWRRGTALVNEHGEPVRADEVPTGGLVTVFPDGAVGSADGQAVLIRLDHAASPAGEPAPGGLIVFSKVCTHAGCPVGLYEVELRQLLCPCHQSAFDVLDGARPVSGPAARPLPRLPIEIDEAGVLRATGDFPDPIGPAWWSG